MSEIFAFALGLATTNRGGQILDCLYPNPQIRPSGEILEAARLATEGSHQISPEQAAKLNGIAGGQLLPANAFSKDHQITATRLDSDTAIESTAAAYLKLHLLSHRLALPNSLNLDGIFAHLPNLAWTTNGPIAIDEVTEALTRARIEGSHLEIMSVDKFPKMVNYVMPSGVRIADASRIRLGAYLGDGTTVMHEGFVNFNAGALGPNMVEGRISQGVTIDAGTDLGGSASTMGTLSGGGEITISLGKNCLVGANAGTGIPLGDRCTIEAGLYITAGTVVSLVNEHREEVRRVKARELAGGSDLLFIRNSQNGQVMCKTNARAIELNDTLHSHN